MQESTWAGIVDSRQRAGNALVLPFVIVHSTVLVVLAFGGDALADSSVQLAVAAGAIIASLWCVMQWDGVFVDWAALIQDAPEGVASGAYGRGIAKAPIGMLRVIGPVFTGVLVVVELLAIY
tara:strand:+ start:352 stop:717 length:366 start_codon:yes stop_codon:yes gene_type:complete